MVILVNLAGAESLKGQSTSWIDFSNGSWSNSGNWSNGVPGANSTASISIGQVTQSITGGTTVQNLNYGFGTSDLNLQTDLEVTGHLNWTDGSISGPSALNLTGTALIEDGDLDGTVNSTADVTLDSFVFFDGSSGTGVWNNLAGSQFNLVDNANLAFSNTFNNQSGAVLRKLASSDDARMSWNLNSDGLIQVDGGRLELVGDSHINGEVQIAAGGTVDFQTIRDYSFGANAVVNGDGVLEFSAGDTTVDHQLEVNSNLRLDGTGELFGSGTLNVNGFLDWDSSFRMLGTGVTNLFGDSRISGGGLERTLNNHGYVNFQPVTFLAGTASTSIWRNKAGSTFDITNDQGLAFDGTFFNEQGAVFVKSAGVGTSNISWDVFNDGIVEAGSGTLWFTGNFVQGSTGELRVSGGTFRFSNFSGVIGGSISGAGTIDSSSVRVTGSLSPGNPTGNLQFTGDLEVDAGAELNFELGTLQDLVIVDGDLSLAGDLNVFALDGFGAGTYTLFEYGGTFVDNGVTLEVAPAGFNYELINDGASSSFLLSVTAVPEPGSLSLIALVAMGLGCRRRKSLA